MTRFLIVAIALAFAVARFFMPSHALSPAGSYEAAAHLFVGGCLGAWLAARTTPTGKLCGCTALALSAVELTAFLLLRGRG